MVNGTSPEDAPSIEIWLTKSSATQDWVAHSVRMKHKDHVHRLVLDDPDRPARTLCAPVAELLDTKLSTAKAPSVFSDTERQLDLPGLHMSGFRLIVNQGENERQSAVARFLRVKGEMSLVLNPRFLSSPRRDQDTTRLTVPVLENLLLPALEIFDQILLEGLSEPQHQAVQARLKTMIEKREELGELSGLLMEFTTSRLMTPVATFSEEGIGAEVVQLAYHHPDSPKSLRWNEESGWERSVTAQSEA